MKPVSNGLPPRKINGRCTGDIAIQYRPVDAASEKACPRDIFGHRTEAFEDNPGVWAGADVWWGRVAGQRLEMGGSTSWLAHLNAVGTMIMETDQTGAVSWDMQYYPYGQFWNWAGPRISILYGGLEWGMNDPLYPSATREYNNGVGRWMTPDPGGRKVVKLDNPQTWNMYAYVGDNPTTFNDPSGMVKACKESSKACDNAPTQKPQGTMTAIYKRSTTTHDSSGDVTVTTTTVTATFNKKTGKFMSANTETTSEVTSADALGRNVVSGRTDTGPHSLTAGQFTNFLNSQPMAVDPGPVVRFAKATGQDIAAHPVKYGLAAFSVAAPFLNIGIPTEVEGLFTAGKALWAAYELDEEVK